jgi:hypothetical protein
MRRKIEVLARPMSHGYTIAETDRLALMATGYFGVPRLCLRHVVQSMTSSVADGLEALYRNCRLQQSPDLALNRLPTPAAVRSKNSNSMLAI